MRHLLTFVAALLLPASAFAARAIMEQTAASNNTIFIATQTAQVGISTNAPQATLDVAGNAQFGQGATKSTITVTGSLVLASGANITLSGGGAISGGALSGNATTASALQSAPTTCTLPNLALGIAANGNASCAQPSNVTGNAATVTNGVYTTGSYADPAWITSLSASKLTGSAATATNLANGGVGQVPYQTGSGATAFLPAKGALGIDVGNGTSAIPSTATLQGTANQISVTQSATAVTLAGAGQTTTCAGGSALTGATYNGGIATGGSCTAVGSGSIGGGGTGSGSGGFDAAFSAAATIGNGNLWNTSTGTSINLPFVFNSSATVGPAVYSTTASYTSVILNAESGVADSSFTAVNAVLFTNFIASVTYSCDLQLDNSAAGINYRVTVAGLSSGHYSNGDCQSNGNNGTGMYSSNVGYGNLGDIAWGVFSGYHASMKFSVSGVQQKFAAWQIEAEYFVNSSDTSISCHGGFLVNQKITSPYSLNFFQSSGTMSGRITCKALTTPSTKAY